MKTRRKTIDIVRFVIFLLLIGAFTEVMFRFLVFPGWRAVGQVPYSFHPIYGTFQKPNLNIRRYNPPNYDVVNRTNSMGFRDREKGFKKDLNGIWVIGASNTYGGFVNNEELFTKRLQDRGYFVANLSSEGHRLPDQLIVIKHMLKLGYLPQAIIAEVTLNNAFGNHTEAHQIIYDTLYLKGQNPETDFNETPGAVLRDQIIALKNHMDLSWISLKRRLLKNSSIYSWAKVGINSIPMMHELTLKIGLRADVAMADSTPVELQRNIEHTPHDAIITSTAEYISELRNWVETRVGVKFGLVVIPSHHHLNPDYFERYLKNKGVPAINYDRTRSYRLFLEELKKHHIATLALAPALIRANKFLSYPDDGHLNAQGHMIVAEELSGWLRNKFGLKP